MTDKAFQIENTLARRPATDVVKQREADKDIISKVYAKPKFKVDLFGLWPIIQHLNRRFR